MWLLSAALAAPPPLELVGLERTPDLAVACVLHLADHDAERAFDFRLHLSAPDASGRSWIQKVVLDTRVRGIPTGSPIATVYELDPLTGFIDERVVDPEGRTHVTRVKPRWVDWSRWPFTLEFVGPRVDDPTSIGAYTLSTDVEAGKQAWGGCVTKLTGPGVSACAIVADGGRSTCLAEYERRHGLGPDRGVR